MPRAGSDLLTEEIRTAVDRSPELRAAVERIAKTERLSKAQVLRRAVREYVERWESARFAGPATAPQVRAGSSTT